ncbi:MAG: potassium channel family protein [Candidatus Methylomirabilia bacterium]
MKVIVVGCGRMGAEIALALARAGKEVTVVDRDRRAFARLGAGFTGATVAGIGFDRDVLVRAGVERSDALAALTSGDNANIVTARIARTIFRVPKVVARVYDPRRAEVYARLGLQTVSTTAWGVSRVQQLLVHTELNVIRSIGSGGLSLVEHEVPSHWVGRDVGHVSVPGEISVTAILRREAALLPARETVFQQGDLAVIAVMAHARGRLEHLLGLRQGGG